MDWEEGVFLIIKFDFENFLKEKIKEFLENNKEKLWKEYVKKNKEDIVKTCIEDFDRIHGIIDEEERRDLEQYVKNIIKNFPYLEIIKEVIREMNNCIK